jgi:hypothetical protein
MRTRVEARAHNSADVWGHTNTQNGNFVIPGTPRHKTNECSVLPHEFA